jgi:hypothetical protein
MCVLTAHSKAAALEFLYSAFRFCSYSVEQLLGNLCTSL